VTTDSLPLLPPTTATRGASSPQVRRSATPDATTPREGRDATSWRETPLWEIRAVRDASFALGLFLVLYVAWVFRTVSLPLLLAFTAAVLVDPLVERAENRGAPRVVAAVAMVVVGLATIVTLVWLGLPALSNDLEQLGEALPEKLSALGLPTDLQDGLSSARDDAQSMLQGTQQAFNFVSGTLASVAFGLMALVFGVACFIFFAAKMPKVRGLGELFPDDELALAKELSAVFEGFVRGQALVAVFTTTGFAIGFSIAGVPYALVAAVIGGVLSFIPNGQMMGWVAAVGFGVAEQMTGGGPGWTAVILYPSLVYVVTQSAETFLITPLVQSSEVKLHPLAVLAALIAGASFAGLVGVFLAIPIAACLRVIWERRVEPALRRRARRA